jgi:hypothetical protein
MCALWEWSIQAYGSLNEGQLCYYYLFEEIFTLLLHCQGIKFLICDYFILLYYYCILRNN